MVGAAGGRHDEGHRSGVADAGTLAARRHRGDLWSDLPAALACLDDDFEELTGIAVEADGALVVTDSVLVVRVDPTTGDRTIVSK